MVLIRWHFSFLDKHLLVESCHFGPYHFLSVPVDARLYRAELLDTHGRSRCQDLRNRRLLSKGDDVIIIITLNTDTGFWRRFLLCGVPSDHGSLVEEASTIEHGSQTGSILDLQVGSTLDRRQRLS